MREIEVMRRIRHHNIIRLEDSFWVDTKFFVCMELVEGKDLLRIIPASGLKEEEAKGIFYQICTAVAYCHANNVRKKSFIACTYAQLGSLTGKV